jgi:hypothetical protein
MSVKNKTAIITASIMVLSTFASCDVFRIIILTTAFIGLDARLAYCSMHQCGTAFEREIKPLAAATLNLLSVEEVGIMEITRDISERKRAEEA